MTFKMEKAKAFDDYFNDPRMSQLQLRFFAKVRRMVHTLLPDVRERVGYAMLGFYAPTSKNLKETLFFITPAENWATLGGTQGLPEKSLLPWANLGVQTIGKGSLRVPYTIADPDLYALLETIITYNLECYQR